MGFSLFSALSAWQLSRAEEKRTLINTMQWQSTLAPVDITNHVSSLQQDAGSLEWRNAVAAGSFDRAHILLLDNQFMDGRVGYYVYAPLRLKGSSLAIMVNLGWVPLPYDRSQVPEINLPRERKSVAGTLRIPPQPVLKLGDIGFETLSDHVYRIQYLGITELQRYLDRKLVPIELRLSKDEDFGYRRNWFVPHLRPERHIAYAVQWFLLAVALLWIYVRATIGKPAHDE